MLANARRALTRAALAATVGLCTAGVAQATPLGLQVGDQITSITWDADGSVVVGDGASFDVGTGVMSGDGRLKTANVTAASPSFPTIVQSNVDLHFDVSLLSSNINATNAPVLVTNAFFGSVAGPDFVVMENGLNILTGNLLFPLRIIGNVNTADPNPQVLTFQGFIGFTGGNAGLLEALGGIGGSANVVIQAAVTGFNLPLNNLASDLNIFNSNFTVDLTLGTITPLSSSPFVPEPSTALLVGGGLVGLLGISRRRARRS